MQQRTVIIDSDAGSDDAVAMVLAFKHARVRALMSVHGNVSGAQATHNLRLIKTAFGSSSAEQGGETEVYAGAAHPLIGRHRKCDWPGHGENGLGDAEFPEYALAPLASPEHAANALVRLLCDAPENTLDVIALGPLTNVALALKLEPRILQRARSWWVMGGTLHARGNTSALAEFNFHQDPEAAAIVLQAFDEALVEHGVGSVKPLNLVAWELCEDTPFQWCEFDRLVARRQSPAASFIHRSSAAYEKCTRTRDDDAWAPCDAYAMAALLDCDFIAADKCVHAAVECGGTLARGALAIEWYAHAGREPNVRLVTKANANVMLSLLERAFG